MTNNKVVLCIQDLVTEYKSSIWTTTRRVYSQFTAISQSLFLSSVILGHLVLILITQRLFEFIFFQRRRVETMIAQKRIQHLFTFSFQISITKDNIECARVSVDGLFDCETSHYMWLRWDDDNIRLGRGDTFGDQQLISCQQEVHVNAIAFASSGGNEATWAFDHVWGM